MTTKRVFSSKCLWLFAPLAAILFMSGCPSKKEAAARKSQQGTGTTAEPDKVLYERALADIKKNRYDEGRLDLQTLINTYPDSEYLAKAKLATADSYYKQGGPTALTQAIAQYQDFITFFPFLDEASYAQMQIAMSHYKRMEKPDRDRSEAMEAEGAFQTFLQKYPHSPLAAEGQQRLREVQEILAEGDFAVARFYYLRRADRASAARLYDLTNRYPLFSLADRANWMLADIASRGEHNDIAAQFYARIVKDYPLSPLAADSKSALIKLGVPVPQADAGATARMQAEQQIPRPKERGGVFRLPETMFRNAPDVRMAARVGNPTMTPENSPAGDTMNPQGGLAVGIAGSGTAAGSAGAAGGAAASAGTGAVATVVPGSSDSGGATAGSDVPAGTPAPDATATLSTPANGSQAAASDSSAAGSNSSTASGDSSAAGTTTGTQANPQSTTNPTNESSSKKKKGLKKLIPF